MAAATIGFVGWWVARGLTVAMSVSPSAFRARGWIATYRLPKANISRFERVEYGGRTVWSAVYVRDERYAEAVTRKFFDALL